MNAEIELQGVGANEQALYAIQDWIKKEKIDGLRIQRKSVPADEGKMGSDLTTILSVVLAAPAIVQLVRCLHTYFSVSRPRFKVKVKTSESDIVIEGENIEELDTLLKRATSLAKTVVE
jgi:hypothetical protein